MKKNFSFIAVVLYAAFTLASCVDLSESQSVTNLRDAKANQLNALAEMYKTQAIADSLLSAAHADLLEAQAEYQRLMTEQARQEFELKIAWLAKDYEYKILTLEYEMQELQRKILNEANEQIQVLFLRYKTELDELNDLKSQLHTQNSLLAEANANLLNAEEIMNREKSRYEGLIAENENLIQIFSSYTGLDRSDILERYNTLYARITPLYADYKIKYEEMHYAHTLATSYIDRHYSLDGLNNFTHMALRIIDSLSTEYGATVKMESWRIYNDSVDLALNDYPVIIYTVYSIDASERTRIYESLKDNTEELEAATALFRELDKYYDLYYKELDDLKNHELINDYFDKCMLTENAYIRLQDVYLEIHAMNEILADTSVKDIQSIINELLDEINEWELAIASLNNVADAEEAIRMIEESIANLTELIAAQELIVAAAKSDLDNALAAS